MASVRSGLKPHKLRTPDGQPKARKKEESNLLADIRNKLGARPDVLMVRINTGVFSAPYNPKTRVRSAPNGYPDLPIIQHRRVMRKVVRGGAFMQHEEEGWFYFGQAIYVETKTKKGVLSDDQKNFKAAAERVGAIYIVARSVDDVLKVLGPVQEWVDGARG